jgi:hypothetical protein
MAQDTAHGPLYDPGERVVMRGKVVRQVDVVCLIEWDDPVSGRVGKKTWHHETEFEPAEGDA